MEILFVLIPGTVLLALVALAAYCWAARNGQFDDLDTPAYRILTDDIEERVSAPAAQDSSRGDADVGIDSDFKASLDSRVRKSE